MGLHKRFRVHKTGETIQLHGIISDASNLRILDEMVSERNVFDCSRVEGTSWNGLLAFDRYLSQLKGHIVLNRVPYHFFQYLRLIPNVAKKYELGEIELTLLPDGQQSSSTRFLSQIELQTLANQTQSPFLRLKDGALIIGRDTFVCPPKFGHRSYDLTTIGSSWYQNNAKQFDFWYDYGAFSNITLSLALDLVQSLESTLEHLLTDVALSVVSLDKALSLLFPEDDSTQRSDLRSVIAAMKASCQDLGLRIDKTAKAGGERLLEIQLLANRPEFTEADALYQVLRRYCADIMELEPAIGTVEEIGAFIGRHLVKVADFSSVRNRLLSLHQVPDDILEAVREAMNIMDPLSEGDWDETRREFFEHLTGTDTNLNKVIILLQGFDLLRQILEHRMKEIAVIRRFLDAGKGDWLEAKTEVYALVNRTLVTDQEKYSCEFFIPEASRVEDNNQKPGELLLF